MSRSLVRTCIYVAFVLSGATGLAYEVLWSKYLTLFIGGTALSHTIVLATFMGGLAVGNALFGRLADGHGRNRLLVYAGLEVGIGLLCLLFPRMFAGLSSLYVAVASHTGPTSPFNPLFKAVLASAVIFLPCALMGGTLPVLVKYVTDSVASAGVRLSWLYFLNT